MGVTTIRQRQRPLPAIKTPVIAVLNGLLFTVAMIIGAVGVGLAIWARSPVDMERLAVVSAFNTYGIPVFAVLMVSALALLIARTRD